MYQRMSHVFIQYAETSTVLDRVYMCNGIGDGYFRGSFGFISFLTTDFVTG